MNPYEGFLGGLNCNTYPEMYSLLKLIAESKLGLDGVPFPLSDLEHPPNNYPCPEIKEFILKCGKAAMGDNSDDDAIKLIQFLKNNPPEESYENPRIPDRQPTKDEGNLIQHIFFKGIELPGSNHNTFGHLQYFSSFFIDMFFGNFTESNDYIKTLSKDELDKAMKKREGYCQYSPLFAPILGLRMENIERSCMFTSQQVQEIRTMYSGCNEHKHLEIMNELIRLGADVNAHDINRYTPLHYAVLHRNEGMITVLLKHGANPNSMSRICLEPLTLLKRESTEFYMKIIDILIQNNAKVTDKHDIHTLRTSVETYGSKVLAVKVREAHPRDKEECEKCVKPASKQCSACGKVYYCTPACQKLDWKFHKSTCQKKYVKQTNEVD